MLELPKVAIFRTKDIPVREMYYLVPRGTTKSHLMMLMPLNILRSHTFKSKSAKSWNSSQILRRIFLSLPRSHRNLKLLLTQIPCSNHPSIDSQRRSRGKLRTGQAKTHMWILCTCSPVCSMEQLEVSGACPKTR